MNASTKKSAWKLIGPGIIVAAAGIGASDIISATVGGARHGVVLLWAIVVGAFFKFILNEGIARWQLATGSTALEGWFKYLPRWSHVLFGFYLLLWGTAVSVAVTSGCGLGIENLTQGFVSHSWGAVLHAFAAFLFVYLGNTQGFEKAMKCLVGVMFVSIVFCALLTLENPWETLKQILIPKIPSKSGMYILSVIGGIGGSVTMLAYNYLLREEKKVDPSNLSYVRKDLALAYSFTAIFGISVMLIAHRAFYSTGVSITDGEAVPKMALLLGSIIGPIGFYIYSLGFWAAVVASLLGIWKTVPFLFMDYFRLWHGTKPQDYEHAACSSSKEFRIGLLFLTLVSIPFAFLQRPLALIILFTILGSLFIPFLAATLLFLNNRVQWTCGVKHNSIITNIILVLALVLFSAIGFNEIYSRFQSSGKGS